MVNEDYEFVSHKKIAELEREVARLRKAQEGSELQVKIEMLDEKIERFLHIIAEAGKDLEDTDDAVSKQAINEINSKLDVLADQNEKIATGILAVADMLHPPDASEDEKEKSGMVEGQTISPPVADNQGKGRMEPGTAVGQSIGAVNRGTWSSGQSQGPGFSIPPPPEMPEGQQRSPGLTGKTQLEAPPVLGGWSKPGSEHGELKQMEPFKPKKKGLFGLGHH